jgi:hypothetical protein
MALGYIFWWPQRPWVNNADHTWTWSTDISIPAHTASTIYAFAAMQYSNGGLAFAGISDYWTEEPGGSAHHPVGNNQRNNVVPAIWDKNVEVVRFLFGVGPTPVAPGPENVQIEADFTFQIFGWE